MGIRTGRPRGRPKGAKSKATIEREAAAAEAVARVEEKLQGAFEGDAHALLVAVYKDGDLPLPVRIDAAKAAIRYEKPALAPQDAAAKDPSQKALPERLKEYAREEAIEASAGKVVELRR